MARTKSWTNNTLRFDGPGWALPDAIEAAAQVLARPELVKELLPALFSKDATVRRRASDTARRVVRCSAIEGLALLARCEPSLRPEFEVLLEEALLTGTLAMRNRAGHAPARWLAVSRRG